MGGEPCAIVCRTACAVAMLASEVARRAICPRDAGRPAGADGRVGRLMVSCGVLLALW